MLHKVFHLFKQFKPLTCTCNGDPREPMFGFGLCNISNTVVRAKNQWIQNETLFKLLDLSYFVRLELHRAVVMDYTNTPVQLMLKEKA